MPKLPSYRNKSLICRANQLTGFYMLAILAFNELIKRLPGACIFFKINPLNASVALNRNQSSDLLCKLIDCFLYEGNTGI